MAGLSIGRHGAVFLAVLGVAACQPGAGPFQRGAGSAGGDGAEVTSATSVRLVDRDVESPGVFQITDQALWDGRPSLGGVWVASPDAKDPERVIMRNSGNGKFVIGALFRRERDNPGPALQISSDAAAALGLLAGEPGTISVTALRREEETPPAAEESARPILDAAETVEDPAPEGDDAATATTAIAVAAIDKAEGLPTVEAAEPPAESVAVDGPKPGSWAAKRAARKAAREAARQAEESRAATMGADALEGQIAGPGEAIATAAVATSPLPAAPVIDAPVIDAPAPTPTAGGALIQIGIFSVEANAKRAVDALAKGGVPADIRSEQTQGKTFWSVTARGDAATLQKVKTAGFADAYVLKR